MNVYLLVLLHFIGKVTDANINYFGQRFSSNDNRYVSFSEERRMEMLEETRKMFQFGYDNYMTHAFPKDELDPIHCTGRGPDVENPDNININDVLGDYSLTLVDALDTLAVMGNNSEFKRAVQLVIENVSFDKPTTVQVFEATIRVLGALLSSHLLIKDPNKPFGDLEPPMYNDELLDMAHDLASRLLPAFDNTATGIPYPRVNLQEGVPKDCINETCLAGAGTLLLEFGVLSRILNDPVYESLARRTVEKIWSFRSNVTGLFGNVINIQTGKWVGLLSGLGAGLDSFFEYLLKAYVLFGDKSDLDKFTETYDIIKYYMRKGRKACNNGTGFPPVYVNVNMKTGEIVNNWIDALQAAWAGVQLLNGDLEEAICTHALYYAIWQRYGSLPERYNWNLKAPDVSFYPLRPELIESTYLLYKATKNPFYLHVGKDILQSLNNHTKVKCGYATIHDVNHKDLEDRMESFFLSETCKYLYLLFDEDNYLNKHPTKYLFTTEGHVFPLDKAFRKKPWEDEGDLVFDDELSKPKSEKPMVLETFIVSNATEDCERIPIEKQYFLPIENRYLQQLQSLVGIDNT